MADKYNGSGKRFVVRSSFSKAIAAGVESPFVLRRLGAGQAVSQSGGNLLITTGTTANSETIIRSSQPVSADLILKYSMLMSQRIANNNFFIELVDYIAEQAPYTINSATSVSVTLTPEQGSRFDAGSVGQTIALGNINGAAGIPMRGTIASVVSNTTGVVITFTVAGWPSTGTGNLDLFGYNSIRLTYNGTTATAVLFDCIRNGYASGDTTAAINTTASPGHAGIVQTEDGFVAYLDRLVASTTTASARQRASRVATTPEPGVQMYIQMRSLNGTSAPASTTTITVNFIGVEDYNPVVMSLQSVRTQGVDGALPVVIAQGAPGNTTSTITIDGQNASGSASVGNPVAIALEARTANTAVSNGQTTRAIATVVGALVSKPYSIPDLDWSYAAAASGIVNSTTAVTIKAAAGSTIRNYLTSVEVMHDALTNATELAIRDGAAGPVIWRTKLPSGAVGRFAVTFPQPLKSTSNTLLEVVTLTASGAGAVYVNATGYAAP